VLIAGGMGVTPFLSHCAALADSAALYELHYSTPTATQAIFTKGLAQSMPANSFYTYASREGRRLNVDALMAAQPPVTHFYVSGPRALVEAVIAAAQVLGLPACHVHFERSMEIAPALSHYINDWRKFELVVG
jgi:ferredoxin-NADP reductase